MEQIQRSQTANEGGHDRWEQYRDRMHVALVKNSQDDIHDEDRRQQQQRQCSEELSENERFALKGALNGWVMRLDLSKGILDVLRSIADRDVW